MKKLVSILLSFVIIISFITGISAEGDSPNINKILNEWQSALNTKNIVQYSSVFGNNLKNDINTAIQNAKTDEDKKYIEFFSTDNIEVKKIHKLSLRDIEDIMYVEKTENGFVEVYYFYYTASLKSTMENKYVQNGENFRICILSKENNEWKISQLSSAPLEALLTKKINLESKKEESISRSLSASPLTLYTSSPTNIRVQLRSTLTYNSKTNYQYWGIAQNSVKTIPFSTYCKDVLPNEWDSDKVVPDSKNTTTNKVNALNAGALMVKTFSWYQTLYPWNTSIGADVNDDSSQCYLHDTNGKESADGKGVKFAWGSMCNTAFSDEYGVAIFNNSTNTPIWARYVQTQQDYTYTYNSQGVTYIINYVYTNAPCYYSNFGCQSYFSGF